jgi:hypothetical protein
MKKLAAWLTKAHIDHQETSWKEVGLCQWLSVCCKSTAIDVLSRGVLVKCFDFEVVSLTISVNKNYKVTTVWNKMIYI